LKTPNIIIDDEVEHIPEDYSRMSTLDTSLHFFPATSALLGSNFNQKKEGSWV